MQIDGSLRSLLQGVSQQNRRDRLEGQCTEQVNMTADVVRNLLRRPPSKALADLFTSSHSVFWHLHDSGDEQYIVAITRLATTPFTTNIKVFNLAGVEQTVTKATNSLNYLTSATNLPLHLSATTIGDYSIIANSQVLTAAKSDVVPEHHGVVIQIKGGGVFGKTYNLTLQGNILATYTTPDAGASQTGTQHIAQQLYTWFITNSAYFVGNGGNLTMYRVGSHLFLGGASGDPGWLDVASSDDESDNDIVVCNQHVKELSDLPKYCFADKVVRITGDDKAGDDDFYMVYRRPAGTGDYHLGTWEEHVGIGMRYLYDETTMPHVLVRTSPGDFYYGPLTGATVDGVVLESWARRDAGDDTSNPYHGFLGQGINFVTQFQNRLVLLSGEFISLSKTNSFFNFFKKTALRGLDDDPIELTTPTAEYTIFRSALQHSRHLVLLSDNAQFVIKGTAKITPENASVTVATQYDTDVGAAQPLSVGGSILFPFKYGPYTGLRDFITGASVEQNLADAITEHVRTYLKGEVQQVIGSANLGKVFVRCGTGDQLKTVYLYQFLIQGDQKVQSAWSKWTFPHEVHAAWLVRTTLYLVMRRGADVYHLASIDLTDEPQYAGLNYNVYMDLTKQLTPNGNLEVTYANVGASASDLLAVVAPGNPYAGSQVQIESVVGTTVTLKQAAPSIILGRRFPSSYTPTLPVMRDAKGSKISTDPLILSWLLISVADSMEFTVDVSAHGITTRQEVDTRTLGLSLIGDVTPADGTFSVSVLEDADAATVTLGTDGPYPLNIIDIEYRGQFQKRGYRV